MMGVASKRAISLGLPALALVIACNGSPSAGGPCESTRDCIVGEVCVGGTCTAADRKSGCKNDGECQVGEWCDPSDQQCKAIETDDSGVPAKDAGDGPDATTNNPDASDGSCTRDDQCGVPPRDICVANQCVKGCNEPDGLTCTGGTTCDPSGHCVDVNAPCTLDAECVPGPPSRICIDQTCVSGCGFDPNLCDPVTEVCDTNTGRCVPAPEPCAGDADCSPPATVCEGTQCVPGCGAAGGIQCSGQTPACNATTGRCEPAPPCQFDSQCTGANEICVNSACVLRCDQPGGLDCGADVCNPNDGRCLPGQLALGDQTCLLDDQCATGICLGVTVNMQSIMVCTDPCGASGQCPLDFNCVSVSGMGFCLSENVFSPPRTFDLAAGGTCSATDNRCQSGWCNTGTSMCIETCSRNADCASYGGNCWTYTQDVNGTLDSANLCFPQDALAIAGVTCANNDACRSGICNRYDSVCAAHCCSDADCTPLQSCTFYDLDATHVSKVCRNRASTGTGQLGDACTAPADCESEVCAPVDPADAMSPRKCSTLCCNDADCAILPLGGRCEPVGTPIANQIAGACTPN